MRPVHMREGQGWKLLFGLFLTSIMAFWIWETSQTSLCELAHQTATLELKLLPSCLEFWLNRYQTLLTGILALAAALLASIPVKRQLKEMSRQTAASARPAIIEMVQALEEEADIIMKGISEVGKVYDLLREFDHEASWIRIYLQWFENCSRVRSQLDYVNNYLIPVIKRHPADSDLNEVRKEMIEILGNLDRALDRLRIAFRQQTLGVYHDEGERELNPTEIVQRRKDMDVCLLGWEQVTIKFYGMLTTEIMNSWGYIRELESYSLPPTLRGDT